MRFVDQHERLFDELQLWEVAHEQLAERDADPAQVLMDLLKGLEVLLCMK